MTVPPVVVVDNPIPVAEPEQMVCDAGVALTIGIGFTFMVRVCELPAQPVVPFVKVGVTASVAVTGEFPLLVAVKEGIPVEFPALLAARPIDGVSFVQV